MYEAFRLRTASIIVTFYICGSTRSVMILRIVWIQNLLATQILISVQPPRSWVVNRYDNIISYLGYNPRIIGQ